MANEAMGWPLGGCWHQLLLDYRLVAKCFVSLSYAKEDLPGFRATKDGAKRKRAVRFKRLDI
jgi:hypothetical protein